MPGLLRGVARTAVVAGTATAVSGRVRRRQESRWAQQEEQQYAEQQPQPAPPAPAAAPPAEGSVIDQLKELGELKAQGILTEEEFAAQKAKLLGYPTFAHFKLDDARIKTLQASGQLPSPLPPYALSPLQYAMGYALWGTPLLFAAAIPFTMRQSRRRKRAGAHLEQALAAHHKGDLDGAIYAFTQAADQDPKLATAFHLRGRVYQDKGDSLKAISDYTKALRLEPKLVDVLWDRGMLLRDMRQFETAISDFTRIAKLTKDDSAALLQRGYVHLAKNDLNRAITDFTAVIERAPEYAEAYRYRSLAYERKGQSAAARADAARANAIMGVTGALG